mmetsp:Transcript_18443/g.62791  ORF Transcript_18443/g.62791 Transcript_18443/m.62791 type:complete len:231 (+) Transcript_18443:523-1215(+)
MRYLIVVIPSDADGPMSSICPLRCAMRSTHAPACSSGTSTTASSHGSSLTPFSSSFMMTLGGPTMNSKPSRRIVSMRMVMWSVPRPLTMNSSALEPCTIFMATFFSSSRSRRSLRLRAVTLSPSLPTKGLEETLKLTLTAGSSTFITGRASAPSVSMIVSPIMASPMPATAQMSPASTASTFLRPKFSKTNTSLIFAPRVPSGVPTLTDCLAESLPWMTRPRAMRPLCSS